MRTIAEIKQQIKTIFEEIETLSPKDPKDKRKYKKHLKQIELLKFCALYLELNPAIESIQRQLAETKAKIHRIAKGFNDWLKAGNGADSKNKKTAYESEMGSKKLKAEKKTLEFILS